LRPDPGVVPSAPGASRIAAHPRGAASSARSARDIFWKGSVVMKTIDRNRASDDARYLSAHEMAALVLLRYAPIDSRFDDPDVTALLEAGLVELIHSASGGFQCAITQEGRAVLQALGALDERH
jgi:hypothetical protein